MSKHEKRIGAAMLALVDRLQHDRKPRRTHRYPLKRGLELAADGIALLSVAELLGPHRRRRLAALAAAAYIRDRLERRAAHAA